MDRKPIDAVLKDATLVTAGDKIWLNGSIHADWRQRFNDGDVVTTSRVVAQYKDVFVTNSGTVYYVASWYKGRDFS